MYRLSKLITIYREHELAVATGCCSAPISKPYGGVIQVQRLCQEINAKISNVQASFSINASLIGKINLGGTTGANVGIKMTQESMNMEEPGTHITTHRLGQPIHNNQV